MVTQSKFNGGAVEQSITGNINLHYALARVWVLTPDVAGHKAILEDATKLKTGGPYYYVCNTTSNAISLRDAADVEQVSIGLDECAKVWLLDNSTAAGTWIVIKKTVGSVADPPSSLLAHFLCGIDSDAARQYDPGPDIWTTKTAAADTHAEGTGFAISARAYLCGSDVNPEDSVNEYDPDTWAAKTSCLQDSERTCGGTVSGFGYMNGKSSSVEFTDEYDRVGDSWLAETDPAQGRGSACADVYNNQLFVMAGGITTSSFSGTVNEAYTPSSETWATKNDVPAPRRGRHDSFAISDKFYLVCGRQHFPTAIDLTDVDEYDPSCGS
jgi:hypothetical protein